VFKSLDTLYPPATDGLATGNGCGAETVKIAFGLLNFSDELFFGIFPGIVNA
jgi:hypothetical protein